MRAEEYREHLEQLMLSVSVEVIGEDGEFVPDRLDSRPTEARLRFTSRTHPDRRAGVLLTSSWLEAFFFEESDLSILKIDDYTEDEYTTDRVRELLRVVGAYLRVEGSCESGRTFLGRQRPQMRFQVGGREWLAR